MLDGTCYFFQVKTRDFYPEKTTQSQRTTGSVLKISSTIIHLNFSLLVPIQVHALKRLQVYLSKKSFNSSYFLIKCKELGSLSDNDGGVT